MTIVLIVAKFRKPAHCDDVQAEVLFVHTFCHNDCYHDGSQANVSNWGALADDKGPEGVVDNVSEKTKTRWKEFRENI